MPANTPLQWFAALLLLPMTEKSHNHQSAMGHSKSDTTIHYLRNIYKDKNLMSVFKNLGLSKKSVQWCSKYTCTKRKKKTISFMKDILDL